ncbi:hypothetical protein [Boseongicola aestuarii]|jgi:hypothetical protein|uniref:DUF3313 domain-containing protein n=1 Tax=Boseongicola aestuarii TaxID=1470561 RepID=A0A238J4M2_9RHOB|nr:hypothetical protein [Boseongicola aestuarii]SMX25172.1 hypothetical protein BOA8489_03307 [Boseongicola aestuarii]
MRRAILALLGGVFLAACTTTPEDLSVPPVPLGDFRLGHNIAIADNVVLGPFSRELTEQQLETELQNAVAKRLRRYDGDGLYHLGIVMGGLVLAQPGIPVVYAPQSVMILDVSVFDNVTQQRLNPEAKRIQVGEGFRNMVPVLGSGLVREADMQLANLSENAAREIEAWLQENPEWFIPKPERARVPFTLSTPAPPVVTAPQVEATN